MKRAKSSARRAVSRKAAERRGRWAESYAVLYLLLRGYRILVRNHRTPSSEVDVLALHRGDLVLVEVKARASWEACEAALDWTTRRRLDGAAEDLAGSRWAERANGSERDVRVDAVLVCGWRVRVRRHAWRHGD